MAVHQFKRGTALAKGWKLLCNAAIQMAFDIQPKGCFSDLSERQLSIFLVKSARLNRIVHGLAPTHPRGIVLPGLASPVARTRCAGFWRSSRLRRHIAPAAYPQTPWFTASPFQPPYSSSQRNTHEAQYRDIPCRLWLAARRIRSGRQFRRRRYRQLFGTISDVTCDVEGSAGGANGVTDVPSFGTVNPADVVNGSAPERDFQIKVHGSVDCLDDTRCGCNFMPTTRTSTR